MAEMIEEAPKSGGSWKKPLIIISLVVLILLTGVGIAGFFLYNKGAPLPGPEEKTAAPGTPPVELTQSADIGPMVDIEEFIVNIISADSNHYVKASLTLELTNEEGSEELTKRMPQTRDAILLLLGNKTYEELQDLQGKKQLKAELINRINSFLQSGKVKSIYFTNFVVQ